MSNSKSQSFCQGYGSILPTFLTYIVPFTLRLDVVISTSNHGWYSVLKIFKDNVHCFSSISFALTGFRNGGGYIFGLWLLINEINQNHESKMPDNLSRNVGLIRELNNNIRKVADLYADLSTNFTRSMDASSEGDSNGALKSDGKAGQKRIRPAG
ncbi:unnamed protein product [Fraxinus pennsylvanica]|uniref:Protein EARLY FLOWERING 4 domain-containing protein n=1 Tax=Fraxinus pennsylvanica TaxID=56036 RepID=A0AAD1ZA05_9LAMI|nr:unnamed protein product [Fraxinus pennsylvanica]